MQIILQEDIPTLGKAGEVVKVRDGYARNFLLPNKKAIVADKGALNAVEHHKKVIASRQAKEKKNAEDLSKTLSGLVITLKRQAGEGGKLFGSVTTKDIADALRQKKIVLDRRNITMATPIREVGTFQIQVKLHSDVQATFSLTVEG